MDKKFISHGPELSIAWILLKLRYEWNGKTASRGEGSQAGGVREETVFLFSSPGPRGPARPRRQ
jgi:hypothetical protein